MISENLFEKYGGLATFHQITTIFYRKVLDTPSLGPFFKDINLDTLIKHQTNLISSALGGPNLYTGRDLQCAHRHLAISQEHFEEVLLILEETLEQMEVESQDIDTIISTIRQFQEKIVNAK